MAICVTCNSNVKNIIHKKRFTYSESGGWIERGLYLCHHCIYIKDVPLSYTQYLYRIGFGIVRVHQDIISGGRETTHYTG